MLNHFQKHVHCQCQLLQFKMVYSCRYDTSYNEMSIGETTQMLKIVVSNEQCNQL